MPPEDSCNQGDILRAIQVAVNILDKKTNSLSLPNNAGKKWTKEDEEILIKMFNDNCSKKEICDSLQRTNGGIASKLAQLGLIQDRHDY